MADYMEMKFVLTIFRRKWLKTYQGRVIFLGLNGSMWRRPPRQKS